MKKLLQSIISVTAAVSLTACSGNTSGNTGENSVAQLSAVAVILNEDEIGGEISISAYDTMGYGRYLEEAAAAFEEKYPNTKVNVNTFSAMPEARTISNGDGRTARIITNERDETAEMDYISNMNIQLMSGGGDDILAVDLIPYYKYADRGIIENLSYYMNEDKDFNKQDYSQNILDAVSYKGGLYVFPIDYSFDFLSYDKRYVNDEMQKYFESSNKFSFDELLELGSNVFNEFDNEKINLFSLYGGAEARPNLFSKLFDIYYNQFVDIENKEVNFNSGSFANLLESISEYEDKGYLLEQVSNNEGLDMNRTFMNNGIASIYNFSNSMALFMSYAPDTGRNVIIAGSRLDRENNGIAGVISNGDGEVKFEYSQAYAINSNSKNKKTAWEFIKFLAGEEMQTSLALRGFPVNDNARAEKAKLSITGNAFMFDEQVNEVSELTDQQQEAYEKYIEAVNNYSDELNTFIIKDSIITSMIETEVINYFNGNKTAEEVGNSLQSRVELYLNE